MSHSMYLVKKIDIIFNLYGSIKFKFYVLNINSMIIYEIIYLRLMIQNVI